MNTTVSSGCSSLCAGPLASMQGRYKHHRVVRLQLIAELSEQLPVGIVDQDQDTRPDSVTLCHGREGCHQPGAAFDNYFSVRCDDENTMTIFCNKM